MNSFSILIGVILVILSLICLVEWLDNKNYKFLYQSIFTFYLLFPILV